jgi:hypothetical protein
MAKIKKFRSKFEADFSRHFPEAIYEELKFNYTTEHVYTPDWEMDGLILETKGILDQATRSKTLAVLQQNPNLAKRFCFVFQDPNKLINKRSKTRYRDWCDKHNILWTTLEKLISNKKVKL